MRRIKLLPVVVAAVTFVCCNKISEDTSLQNEGNFTLTAQASEAVKTALDAENFITWKAGDQISIWEVGNPSNANVQLTLDASSAGKRAGDFTGTFTPATAQFSVYALYPWSSSYSLDPSAVALNVPATVNQCSDVNEVVGVSDFMVGSAKLTQGSAKYEMLFRYPLSLLKIVVDGSNSVLSQATVKSLTITANVPFVGDATMNLTTGELVSTGDDAGKTLTINYPETAKMSSSNVAWVAILPTDLTSGACCFDLKMTNGQEIKFNVNPKAAFEAQNIYTINLTNIDTHVDNGEANPVFFDLVGANTAKGYSLNRANCYIVNEGGYYKFAAQRVDKSNVFEGNKPATDGYTANWLWSTGTESLVDFVSMGNSGAVNFRVKANAKGNAVLAVRNSDNNIVWSWHIWCTSSDPMTPMHWSRGNTWLVSNMNVGAVSTADSDTDAYGLYYQWGRKDPFPADKSKCVVNEGVTIGSVAGTSLTEKSVEYAIANPTTFINANTYQTWLTSDDAPNAQSLWNNNKDASSSQIKTIYDPCPAGYGVPMLTDYAWYTYFVLDNLTFKTAGVLYAYGTDNSSYYPAAGYLKDGTLTDPGVLVRNWSACINGTPAASTNMQAKALQVNVSTHAISKADKVRTAFALPVRCMKLNK